MTSFEFEISMKINVLKSKKTSFSKWLGYEYGQSSSETISTKLKLCIYNKYMAGMLQFYKKTVK